MNDEAVVCVKCGVPAGKGTSYCPHCGAEVNPEAVMCVACGTKFAEPEPEMSDKSKLAAGLLGIFLGAFGVHNFYLGNTGKAIAQLLLGTVGALACGIGPAVSSIWGLIEGILVLCDNITTDSEGKKLK
jgi:TM2 domain-containing membrane protein YozV